MTATFGETCKGADHFGLMLSPVSSADNGYLFGISCDGKYVLWKWDGTRMTALVKWTTSDGIQAGANKTNRIGIKAEGNKLSLYANGILLTELTDKSYDKVYFGSFCRGSGNHQFPGAGEQLELLVIALAVSSPGYSISHIWVINTDTQPTRKRRYKPSHKGGLYRRFRVGSTAYISPFTEIYTRFTRIGQLIFPIGFEHQPCLDQLPDRAANTVDGQVGRRRAPRCDRISKRLSLPGQRE